MSTLLSETMSVAGYGPEIFGAGAWNSSGSQDSGAMTDHRLASRNQLLLAAFAEIVAAECGPDSEVAHAAAKLSRHRSVKNLDDFEKVFWTLPEDVSHAVTSAVREEFHRLDFDRLRREYTLREKAKFIRVTAAGVRESHVHDVNITKETPNYRID